MITLEQGIETFCSGFTYTRSFTHPYIYERTDAFWQMKDGPRKSGDRRASEVITTSLDAARTFEFLRGLTGDRLFLCVLLPTNQDETPIIADYKAHGCRLMNREPMMVRDLENLPLVKGPFPIRRITDVENADRVAQANRTKQILSKDLHESDANLRLFAAWRGRDPVGWVRSIRTSAECSWVSNMFVKKEFRQQGIGKSLMAHMLADDAKYGFQQSVLLASHTGTLLYDSLGYQRLGTLLLFDPKRVLNS